MVNIWVTVYQCFIFLRTSVVTHGVNHRFLETVPLLLESSQRLRGWLPCLRVRVERSFLSLREVRLKYRVRHHFLSCLFFSVTTVFLFLPFVLLSWNHGFWVKWGSVQQFPCVALKSICVQFWLYHPTMLMLHFVDYGRCFARKLLENLFDHEVVLCQLVKGLPSWTKIYCFFIPMA